MEIINELYKKKYHKYYKFIMYLIFIAIIALIIWYIYTAVSSSYEMRNLPTKKEVVINGVNPTLNLKCRYIRLERNDGLDKEIQLSEVEIFKTSPNDKEINNTDPYQEELELNDFQKKIRKNNRSFIVKPEKVIIEPPHQSNSFGSENFNDGSYLNLVITAPSKDAFIEIDLGKEEQLSGIFIYNRKDCCQEKLMGVSVKLLSLDKIPLFEYKINNIKDQYKILVRDFEKL